MKNIYIISIISIILLSISGCDATNIITGKNFTSPTASQLSNATTGIDRSVTNIEKSSNKINGYSEKISKKASNLIEKTSDSSIRNDLYSIQNDSNGISTEALNIKEQSIDIQQENSTVSSAIHGVEKMDKKLRGFEEDGAAEARKNLYKMVVGMAAMGGLIIMGGVVLAFFNPKLGGMVAGFGLVVTTIATAGTFYLEWIALIGFALIGIGLLVTLGFFVRSFWYARKLQEAHEASVELIDEMKYDIPEDLREELFSDGGKADTIQSASVKKTISKTRKKLKDK